MNVGDLIKRREWLKAMLAIPAAAIAMTTAKPKPTPTTLEWFWCDNEDAFDVVERLRLLEDYEITPGSIIFSQNRTTGRLSTPYLYRNGIPETLREQVEARITIAL